VSRYYYFAATLPALQVGMPAPMTSAEFLERCTAHLPPAHLAAVAAATISSPATAVPPGANGSTLLVRYYAWEWSLRNELVRLRARRLERAPEPWVRPVSRDDIGSRVAQSVFQAASPLEAELLLERERWAVIESLKALHYFDLEYLVAYRLQLEILVRLARLREEAGEAHYRETYAAILAAAPETSPGVVQ